MVSTKVQNAVIDFIEAYHTGFGEFPGRSQISGAAETASARSVTPEELDELIHGEQFIKSLDERGIIPPWILHQNPVGLTTEQIAVASALNNTADRRSNSRKLEHLGVSSRKYAGWMHNKVFSNYMRISANNLLENTEHAAHISLLDKVQAGDISAVKFFFEMTGRYNPSYESAVDAQALMSKVIEIIQRHVSDPESLMAIAADLQLASVESGVTGKTNDRAIAQPSPRKQLANDPDFERNRKALFF